MEELSRKIDICNNERDETFKLVQSTKAELAKIKKE